MHIPFISMHPALVIKQESIILISPDMGVDRNSGSPDKNVTLPPR